MDYYLLPGAMTEQELMASVYLLKGTVFQALDNHQFAAQCFKLALKVQLYLETGLFYTTT